MNRSTLRTAGYENWNANPGADPAVLADIGYATPENLEQVIDTTLAREKAGETFVIASEVGATALKDAEVEIDEIRVKAEALAARHGGHPDDYDPRYR